MTKNSSGDKTIFRRLPALLTAFMLALPAVTAAQQELRRCPNEQCRRYAYSQSWTHCPFCGTKLPREKQLEVDDSPTLKGNVLIHPKKRFLIERPSEAWTLKYGDEAKQQARIASVFMADEDNQLFIMVAAEHLPNAMPLVEYARLAQPRLRNRQTVDISKTKVDEKEAIHARYQGKKGGVTLIWDQTIVINGPWHYQVNCWGIAAAIDEPADQQFDHVVDSFKMMPVESNQPKQDARQEQKQDESSAQAGAATQPAEELASTRPAATSASSGSPKQSDPSEPNQPPEAPF
jgi:hypothetical protein